MTITKIAQTIDCWKSKNGGQCPTLEDLGVVFGGDQISLLHEIEEAKRLLIIYEPQIGRYDYRPDMI